MDTKTEKDTVENCKCGPSDGIGFNNGSGYGWGNSYIDFHGCGHKKGTGFGGGYDKDGYSNGTGGYDGCGWGDGNGCGFGWGTGNSM